MHEKRYDPLECYQLVGGVLKKRKFEKDPPRVKAKRPKYGYRQLSRADLKRSLRAERQYTSHMISFIKTLYEYCSKQLDKPNLSAESKAALEEIMFLIELERPDITSYLPYLPDNDATISQTS